MKASAASSGWVYGLTSRSSAAGSGCACVSWPPSRHSRMVQLSGSGVSTSGRMPASAWSAAAPSVCSSDSSSQSQQNQNDSSNSNNGSNGYYTNPWDIFNYYFGNQG